MMWFKYLIIYSVLIFLPIASWADVHTVAAPYAASDVQTAIDAAEDGDIVSIPTCDVTWTSSVTITKAITLQGTGYLDSEGVYQTGTKITYNGTMVAVDNNAGGADPVRITGIHFDRVVNTTEMQSAVTVNGGNYDQGELITEFRMDNCRFDWGWGTNLFNNVVFGVVNSNYYYNINHGIQIEGSGNAGWDNYSYAPGTADMLFYEDNIFYWDATTSSTGSWDGIFYNVRGGARVVVRNNDFDASTCTTCRSMGVLHLYRRWGREYRGTMLVECYDNTVNLGAYAQNLFGWRGGSLLLYNNTTLASNYQNWASAGEHDVYDPYPMQDQVNNSFIWGNTHNGSAVGFSDINDGSYNNRVGVQGDGESHTEVWLQEPAASGGKNVYSTTGNGDTDMCFSSSGANAYYPYTPYAYPHPLTAAESEDTTPPVCSGGSPTGTLPTGTTSTTLSVSTNENATCRYSTTAGVSYSSMTAFSTTGGTSHSTTVSGLSDGDFYSYCVRCQDDSGNANTSDYSISFSVAVSDFELPTIPSNLQASSVSSSQINLTWTASTDNVGVTGYKIYRDGVQVDTSPTNSYPDTGLSPSTTYTYAVSAYDAEGNESNQSSSASATTPAAAAAPAFIEAQSGTITSPMQIVSDVDASEGAYIQTIQANSGTATYTFNIDESGICKIIARVYAFDAGSDSFYVKIDDGEEFVWHLNPSQSPDEFNVWREDEVTATGDDPYTIELTQGTHTITFRGRETNCRLDYFYFSKVEGLDEESPRVTITQPISGNTYSTEEDSINLGGSASDNIGVTSVTWTNSRGGNGTASGTDNWTMSNIPLQEDDNTITVTAHDAAGNTGSDTLTVTYTPPDFQPPTIPSGLQASSVSSSQINLTWTASTDDVGVTGYIIYRDGVQVDTSPTNSYSDTGLSPSTTYTYAVSAYDAEGNESNQSSTASATTPAAAPAFIEAQSGTITSPMQIVSDAEASEGAYIQTIQADSGTATYTFNIDESGIYKIIARVYAFDAGSDSFYVKIDDGEEFVWHLNPSQSPDEFNVWREDEVTATGEDPYTIELTQGTYTITFRGRETNCRLDYFYFSKASAVSEAESGTITSPMQIVSDVDASEGAYIQTIQENSGTATYTFNIEESGIYKIIVRVYAFDTDSDSFYVKIDDGEEFVWHLNPQFNPDEFNVWREDEVTATGDDPYTIELTQGTHTITFRGRETNCRLDYFYFLQVDGLSDPKNFIIN